VTIDNVRDVFFGHGVYVYYQVLSTMCAVLKFLYLHVECDCYRMLLRIMGCLHDSANVQQTSSKCIQNTRANAGRLLDRVNTPLECAWRGSQYDIV